MGNVWSLLGLHVEWEERGRCEHDAFVWEVELSDATYMYGITNYRPDV